MTDPIDRYEGLPPDWSPSVKETYAAIEEAHESRMTAEQATTLYEACAMLDTAERLDAQVRNDGLMIINARGAQALHPGISEARAQRRTALAAIRGIALKLAAQATASSASSAGAALVANRWRTS